MKKIIIVVVLALFALSIVSSAPSLLQSQRCCRNGVVSIDSLEDACGVGDVCKPKIEDPQAFTPDVGTPEQTSEEKSELENASLDRPANSTQFNNGDPGAFPAPDGRIYSVPEEPYPYIPTCTPKGPVGVPITPLEPMN